MKRERLLSSTKRALVLQEACSFIDRPCAIAGLTSYRYSEAYGYVMIGAKDHEEALREAYRSISPTVPTIDALQVWNGQRYVYVTEKR